jgi:hypothetical protein
MSDLDIVFTVRTATSKRYNVIEMNVFGNNRLAAYMAGVVVALKDAFVTHLADGCRNLTGVMSSAGLISLQRVCLSPCAVAFTDNIGMLLTKLDMVHAHFLFVLWLIQASSLSQSALFSMYLLILLALFKALLTVSKVSLAALLIDALFILASPLVMVCTIRLRICGSMCFLGIVFARFALVFVPVSISLRYVKVAKKKFFLLTCATKFGGEQGQLNSMIQYGHGHDLLNRFVTQALDVLEARLKPTYMPSIITDFHNFVQRFVQEHTCTNIRRAL